MLKPIDLEAVRQPQQEVPPEAVNTVFKVLHGFYGNLFLSKFSTGQVDAQGKDKGIKSAQQVWAHGLRDYDAQTIDAALHRCQTIHTEYPPSLPQFLAICSAAKPREAYKPPALPALSMSQELREEYLRTHREKALAAVEKLKESREVGGLDLLKQAIANAVATAGGDEAAELRRLDLMLAPRARKEIA